jgi:hypothetical protein
MVTLKRCRYKVLEKFTKKLRLCKKNKHILDYCCIHNDLVYNKYIIKIQSVYRSYNIRKKLKINSIIKIQSVYRSYHIRKKLKIFNKLPRDLQRKILWYVNEDIYIKHYNNSIANIIYNKHKNFHKNVEYTEILNARYNTYYFDFNKLYNYKNGLPPNYELSLNDITLINFLYELYNIIKLTIKYKSCINRDILMKSNNISFFFNLNDIIIISSSYNEFYNIISFINNYSYI